VGSFTTPGASKAAIDDLITREKGLDDIHDDVAALPTWIVRKAAINVSAATTVPAGSYKSIRIAASVGEQWEVDFGITINDRTSGTYVQAFIYDSINLRTHYGMKDADVTAPPKVRNRGLITPDIQAEVGGKNASGYDRTLTYGYSGFKVGSPIPSVKIIRVNPTKPKAVNPHSAPPSLPPPLDALNKYAFHNPVDGELSILLEKDVVLAVDEKGNVIETASSWITLDSFKALFGDIIADVTKRPCMDFMRSRMVERKSVWVEIIDKWRAEGIEF